MTYLKNMTTLKLDNSKCTGCGICIDVCPHNVFAINNGKSQIINKDNCMECGACKRNCPINIIEVDSGVGCAQAIINGLLSGKEASCDCSGKNAKSSCC